MIVNANSYISGRVISTDICIIGAGPVGIALALELKGTAMRVLLVESGGFERNKMLQAVNRAELIGDPYQQPEYTRRRQFGGTAWRWNNEDTRPQQPGVRYMPLDSIDFEPREWIPHSGWPFDRASLASYFERTHQFAKLGPYAYSADAWSGPDLQPLQFKSDTLESGVYQFTGYGIYTDKRREFEQAENITLLHDATALEITVDEGSTNVTGILLRSTGGSDLRVSANVVIMAGGGIENARLLLLSRSKQPQGLGNQHDVVGRYFMDHPFYTQGLWIPTDRTIFERLNFYDTRQVDNYTVLGRLHLSPAVLRREQLRNLSLILYPRRPHTMTDTHNSFMIMWDGATKMRRIPKKLPSHIMKLMTGVSHLIPLMQQRLNKAYYYHDLEEGGWSTLSNKAALFNAVEIMGQIEQTPHRENRVTLSTSKDSFGQPRSRIYWYFREEDKESIRRARQLITQEFALSGLGKVTWPEALYKNPGTHHHMGSTRMGVDPTMSVVDADCKVHGINNLYIAGSSVFPTGGYANPTLTAIALAFKLADHLKQTLGVVPHLSATK